MIMKRLTALFAALLLCLSLAACGGGESAESPSPTPMSTSTPSSAPTSAPEAEGTLLETAMWSLTYTADWSYDEEADFDDYDGASYITLRIMDGEQEYASVYITADVESKDYYRGYLDSYGFDAYELVENNAYEFVNMGGVDCLQTESNYWGEPCRVWFGRVEGAETTVFVRASGEYEDTRVAELLSTLEFVITDTGAVDPPWPWNGTPFAAENMSAMVGTYTVNSQWIPITDSLVTGETFEHDVAVTGDKAYLLNEGTLSRYAFDGTTLVFEEKLPMDAEYAGIAADNNGALWLGGFMESLVCLKDGVQTAAYDGPDYVAMHPSGTWGISWFSSAECEKFDLSGGAYATTPIIFSEVDLISCLMVDENHIYVAGSSVETGKHTLFVYDLNGGLEYTLTDDEGSLGSITFSAETDNGFIALDGNMREVLFWTKDGTYIGALEDSDLFGTDYPWFCSGTLLEDGSILVIMTEEREDESADELVAFRLSGF